MVGALAYTDKASLLQSLVCPCMRSSACVQSGTRHHRLHCRAVASHRFDAACPCSAVVQVASGFQVYSGQNSGRVSVTWNFLPFHVIFTLRLLPNSHRKENFTAWCRRMNGGEVSTNDQKVRVLFAGSPVSKSSNVGSKPVMKRVIAPARSKSTTPAWK